MGKPSVLQSMGCKELDMTEQLDNSTYNYKILATFPMLHNTSCSLSYTQYFILSMPPPNIVLPPSPLVTTSLFSVSVFVLCICICSLYLWVCLFLVIATSLLYFLDCFYVCVLSCVQLFETLWTVTRRLSCPWDYSSKNTGMARMGCHFFLQGIFLNQGASEPVSPA